MVPLRRSASKPATRIPSELPESSPPSLNRALHSGGRNNLGRVPVMLLCHTLGIGGSERQLTETAKALDPARFDVHVGAFHTKGLRAGELEGKGIPVVEIPVRSFGSASVIQ